MGTTTGPQVRRFLRWYFAALALVCAALGSRRAAAVEIAGAEVEVVKAPSAQDCPDAVELARAVTALGTAEGDTRAPNLALRVEVEFSAGPSGYQAVILSSGRKQGRRQLSMPGPSCVELAEATSVALAVLLDLIAEPEASETPAPAQPEPEPRFEPKPQAEPEPQPVVSAPRASRQPESGTREATFAVGVGGGASYGLAGPKPWPLLSARLVLSSAPFEIATGAFWSPSRHIPVDPGTVEVMLAGLRLDGCWSPEAEPAGPGLCGGLVGGWLRGEGSGFDDDRAVTRPYLAASASASWRFALSRRGALRVALSAVVPWHEESFTVAPSATAYTTEPVAAMLEIGPELRIW